MERSDLARGVLDVLLERGLALVDGDAPPVGRHAFEHCVHAANCWRGSEDRVWPADCPRGHVSLPWIGSRYRRGGIAVIGINMNDHGGLAAQDGLVRGAVAELRADRKRVCFGNADWSTPFYYGVAVYARIALASLDPTLRDLPAPDVFESIALTNTIACSPRRLKEKRDDRSRPTTAMWRHCPQHILRPVLDVLEPSIALVLGKSDNMWHVLHGAYTDGIMTTVPTDGRWIWTRRVERGPLIVGLAHPCYPRARHADVVTELDDLLSSDARHGARPGAAERGS
jgi:hypothetical protein